MLISASSYGQVKVIAHRGLSSLAPENTLEAFQQAIDLGADYIELDVRTTKDDSLVVIHDATIDRTCTASGAINELPFNTLRKFSAGYTEKFDDRFHTERIPTLRETLLLAKDKIKVCIEIKRAVPEKVVELVRELNMTSQVIILSFDYNILSRVRAFDQNISLIFLRTIGMASDIEKASEINAYGVAFYFATQNMIKKAHNRGLKFWRWTMNSTSKMVEMIDEGTDGIITDYPQLLKPLVTDDDEDFIRLFPNPFGNHIEIHIKDNATINSVEIYDVQGKLTDRLNQSFTGFTIWVPNLHEPGTYIFKFRLKDRVVFKRTVYTPT